MVGKSAWMRRAGVACALLAAAWALAQGPMPGAAAAPEAAAANHPPSLVSNADGGLVTVRAGERATLAIEALDPDLAADGGFEPVWLGAAADGTLPEWISAEAWSAGPSARPRLELAIAPPFDAAPGRYAIHAGATDARGLTALGTFTVAVTAPRCGGLEVNEGGLCRRCPEHAVPNAARTDCEPCPSGTERPVGATSCAACPTGLASGPGEACGCGPARVLVDGTCVDCPPHTERLDDACVACPPGSGRPAGVDACTGCKPGSTSQGRAACAAAPAPSVGLSKRSAPATAPDTTASASGPLPPRPASGTDTTPPRMVAANYLGRTVTVTVSEPVWTESPASPKDFVVRSNRVFAVSRVGVASRRADAGVTITLTLAEAVTGPDAVRLSYDLKGDSARRPRDAAGNRMAFHTVTAVPRRTLKVGFAGLSDGRVAEDAGEVGVTLALDNPPGSGSYTGCGLRLAAGGAAVAADVEFPGAGQALNPGNGWRAAAAKLLKIVDDGLAEGDEALAVEARCTGGAAGMDPAAPGLVSEPATVTIADDESRTIALSAAPASIPETAGATQVTVTATLDGEATEQLDLALGLSDLPDGTTVAGTRRIAIAAGATSGSTALTVTPKADADDVDQSIAIGATLTGYAVTGAAVTIAEPPPPPTVVASVASRTLAEDAGKVNVTLTLGNPPPAGAYTGCRLRLGKGGAAGRRRT